MNALRLKMGTVQGVPAVPVWLLDVDGVLNATHPCWDIPARTAVVDGGGRFTFRWDERILERVRLLARSERVEVRWATTWVPWRSHVEEALSLPELPVAFDLDADADWVTVDECKIAAALSVVEHERRPLIWTDDDAVPARGLLRDRIEQAGPPALLVRPSESRGLTSEHLSAIEAFISEHS